MCKKLIGVGLFVCFQVQSQIIPLYFGAERIKPIVLHKNIHSNSALSSNGFQFSYLAKIKKLSVGCNAGYFTTSIVHQEEYKSKKCSSEVKSVELGVFVKTNIHGGSRIRRAKYCFTVNSGLGVIVPTKLKLSENSKALNLHKPLLPVLNFHINKELPVSQRFNFRLGFQYKKILYSPKISYCNAPIPFFTSHLFYFQLGLIYKIDRNYSYHNTFM